MINSFFHACNLLRKAVYMTPREQFYALTKKLNQIDESYFSLAALKGKFNGNMNYIDRVDGWVISVAMVTENIPGITLVDGLLYTIVSHDRYFEIFYVSDILYCNEKIYVETEDKILLLGSSFSTTGYKKLGKFVKGAYDDAKYIK